MRQRHSLFHSYTLRLALLYAIIFSASTLLLFYFFYIFTASYMTQQMDSTIQAEIQGLVERYDQEGLRGLTTLISERVNRQQATGNSIYLLTTFTLQPVVGNLDRWPSNASSNNDWIEFSLERNEQTNETHLARAKIFRLPEKYGLLVGRDINQLTEAKRRIIQALAWGLVIMVLLAFLGGLVLSRKTVRKIERINQTTKSIMSGDLSRRIPVTGRNDDFDQVADNLNQMLDRIQMLMEDVRRVSDNIAHDLRTPLARLRQHLEEARLREEPTSKSAINLEQSIKEADSLLVTFNALLRIARIEAGQVRAGFSMIDFHALLRDIVEFYEPLIEEKHQTLETTLQANIKSQGDQNLLFQAFANVVENAIKYMPDCGNLSLSLIRLNAELVITIADNGPGIPESERDTVFRRFYRLDQSRSSSGNGLGLSMVSAVIALHRGTISLQDNAPGLRVIIRLPLTESLAKTQLVEAPPVGESVVQEIDLPTEANRTAIS
ncbi:ATP-binding protein [Candidatus Spongiihabitans sp.]|uniref:sensor histidine kinase n=1 Tax=Candidatus Spongiihabitans sp. TaxID=3101308 RepID=UPI003C6EB82B